MVCIECDEFHVKDNAYLFINKIPDGEIHTKNFLILAAPVDASVVEEMKNEK